MAPTRDPQATRDRILEVTAAEMAEKGFKATSLADILNKADVSKGALYHHFPNKLELGYAVFDEIYIAQFLANWNIPMGSDDPLEALSQWLKSFTEMTTLEELHAGCPICNLANEMSNVEEGFRERAFKMFVKLEERLAESFEKAKQNKQTRQDINSQATAKFVAASLQGMVTQGKYIEDIEVFRAAILCMSDYILSLKA